MIYGNAGGIRYPLKQDLALEFCGNLNKDISVLTENHISHNQIHHIRRNYLRLILFNPRDSHTERLLVLLHLGLE